MDKVKITQIKSVIDRSEKQKKTVRALGLNGISQSVVHEVTPQIKGMIDKVSHLLKVEKV
ncbi:MAG: 50S ribosomal protein L30 [Saprospiraceae bacterium]|nr:50S ribosomal protein L30 [Saprospiraceae bacterium]